jgi:prepilin-type N-terminal cleavage/methylation domain-containing protein
MKITRSNTSRNSQAGFTIVELMIALAVLSVLLVMASVIMLQIGKMYSKGVNAAAVQTASRDIVGTISNTLQFSGDEPSSCSPMPATGAVTCAAHSAVETRPGGDNQTVYAYCIGTTRYTYVLGPKLSSTPNAQGAYHVLWQDKMSSPANTNCYPLNINTAAIPSTCPGVSTSLCAAVVNSGKELIPQNMRLTRFLIRSIDVTGTTYGVDAWLAFGDDDLLTIANTSAATPVGVCDPGQGGKASCAGYVHCNGGIGQEYCATSQLSTTVTRRL